ncbi:MAG TPA: hypothetical protein VHO67_12805 [Polyangia bacterium]|nr:hypothetical protein [Polyangia bacterium]
MPSRSLLVGLLVPCLAAACGKSSLDSRDAGRDTSVADRHPADAALDRQVIDAGPDRRPVDAAPDRPVADAAHDGGADAPEDAGRDVATDAGGDGPAPAGRRAFDVLVKLTFTTPVSGSFATSFPTSATATLVLDDAAGSILIGGEGQGSTAKVTITGGGLAASAPLTLAVPYEGACQGSATLQFSTLNVTVGSDGKLRGTATGSASYLVTDVGYTQAFTATLDGVADTTRPAVPIRSAAPLDPLAPARFAVSEPLPAGAKAELVAADGTVVELLPEMSQLMSPPAFITGFRVPYVLPFGGTFHLAVDQMLDFAGNPGAPQPAPLATLAAPPLLTDGGFESTPAGMTSGGLVFASGDLPVIAGAQSFYLDGNGPPWQAGVSATFRLAVAPGGKTVRFSYRVTSTYQASTAFPGTILLATVGSKPVTAASLPTGIPTTTITRASGGTLIVGPVSSAAIPLPDTTATEAVIRISTPSNTCGGPLPPGGGLIIDDLRVGP